MVFSVWGAPLPATRRLTIRKAGTDFVRVLALFLGPAPATGDFEGAATNSDVGGAQCKPNERVGGLCGSLAIFAAIRRESLQ